MPSDIFFIGFQESLADDFKLLRSKLGLPDRVELPDDDVLAHRNPKHLDKTLEDQAIENLKRWYKDDYGFYGLCKGILEYQHQGFGEATAAVQRQESMPCA